MTSHASAPDLSWADDRPLQTAVVIFDSHYGKTRAVAEALARGIRSEGVATEVVSIAEAGQRAVDTFDLLAIGSPAHLLTSSRAVHRFLRGLRRIPRIAGRYGYAFETRLRHHPAGAGHQIEAALVNAGLRVVRTYDTAVIETSGTATAPAAAADGDGFSLEREAVARFEAIGSELVQEIRGESPPNRTRD